MSHCKSCGAEVMWLRNASTGKVAPIDANPSENGNIAIDDEGGDTYRVVRKSERSDYTHLHTNHFVTCPQAKQWGPR